MVQPYFSAKCGLKTYNLLLSSEYLPFRVLEQMHRLRQDDNKKHLSGRRGQSRRTDLIQGGE
jgi:hypothetical protein